MSKCASSVISPIFAEVATQPQHRGTSHRVIAADEQGQRMCFGAHHDGLADTRRGVLDTEAGEIHVAAVRDFRLDSRPVSTS